MKTLAASPVAQLVVLALLGAGWLFALVEFYAYHTTAAQTIADGGWAALLAILRIDLGTAEAPPGVTAPLR